MKKTDHTLAPLMLRARFLTEIGTETLMEAVTNREFHRPAARLFLALMLAELAYRLRIRHGSVNHGIWQAVFGQGVPMHSGFCAPSAVWPHERNHHQDAGAPLRISAQRDRPQRVG
jgi:hypothetical protein